MRDLLWTCAVVLSFSVLFSLRSYSFLTDVLSNISGTFCTAYFLHADSILVKMCVVLSWNYLCFSVELFWSDCSLSLVFQMINPTHFMLVYIGWSVFGFSNFFTVLFYFWSHFRLCLFLTELLSTMFSICTYGPIFTFSIIFSMLLTTLFHLDREIYLRIVSSGLFGSLTKKFSWFNLLLQ